MYYLQVYGYDSDVPSKRLALSDLHYFAIRQRMRWPVCQNTADFTALVAPQPEIVGVLYFKTKMAGNRK